MVCITNDVKRRPRRRHNAADPSQREHRAPHEDPLSDAVNRTSARTLRSVVERREWCDRRRTFTRPPPSNGLSSGPAKYGSIEMGRWSFRLGQYWLRQRPHNPPVPIFARALPEVVVGAAGKARYGHAPGRCSARWDQEPGRGVRSGVGQREARSSVPNAPTSAPSAAASRGWCAASRCKRPIGCDTGPPCREVVRESGSPLPRGVLPVHPHGPMCEVWRFR